jgi:hypothetical protein
MHHIIHCHDHVRKIAHETSRYFSNRRASNAGGPSFTLSEPFSAKNAATLSGFWLHHAEA